MLPEVKCPVCHMIPVVGCRNMAPGGPGGGIIHRVRDDDVVIAVSCPNMRKLRMQEFLERVDPQLPKSPFEKRTPLFQQKRNIDRTRDNLLLKRLSWPAFLRHFKWVLGNKGPSFFVRVVTDMTILNVFVGNTNVKSRILQKELNGSLLVSNSLEDLLSDPDLVVIRLGHLVHSNKAAANILLESLHLRVGRGSKTWLIEPPGNPFAPYVNSGFGVATGMPSCNDDVLAFVHENFEEVFLGKASDPQEAPQFVVDEEDGTVEVSGPDEFNVTTPPEEATSDESLEEDEEGVLDEAAEIEKLVSGPTKKKATPNWKRGRR